MVQRKFMNKGKCKVAIHNIKTLRNKMNELQEEIGFLDDEISVIIFTSIDSDWFTNLIVQ